MDINIKLKSPLAKIPTYATDGSGCFDLYGTNLHHAMAEQISIQFQHMGIKEAA